MSYTPHNFQSGDTLYAADLNEMDQQIAAVDDKVTELEDGKKSTYIGDATTMSYSSYRYTTGLITYNEQIDLISSDGGADTEYSWRIFDEEGGYISSAWNTEYTIPANTKFQLLIRKTVNGTQVGWDSDEANVSVKILTKTKIQKQIDAIDARVTSAEADIVDLDERVDEIEDNMQSIVPQTDVVSENVSGSIVVTGSSANKANYIGYNFISGNEYKVTVIAKGSTALKGSRTLVIATSPVKNIAHAVDYFSNTDDSPMGIIANLTAGEAYTGTLTASGDAAFLCVVAYTSQTSDFDIDVTISKTADIKKTVEKVFDYSIRGLNADIEPAVLQLRAEIPSASDKGDSPYHRLTFAHISDIHGHEDRWKRICDYIDEFDHIAFGVHTGDYTGSYIGDMIDLYGAKKPKNKPMLTVVGNHDTFATVNPYTPADKHTVKEALYASIDPVADGWDCTFGTAADSMYWYKDNDDSKVRLIALDQYYWDEAENTWFTSVLADALDNDMAIVVLMHTPMTKKVTSIGSTFWTRGGWDTGTSETENDPTIVAIRTAINDFIDDGGTFICYLCGHIHSDQIGTLTTDGLLQIRIECASGQGVWCESDRTVNTKNYDCLNLIQIDRAYGTVKVVRVGVNVDPHMQNKNVVCYDYVNKTLIANW